MTNYRALQQDLAGVLRATCGEDAVREARYLVQYVTGWDAAKLIACGGDTVSQAHRDAVQSVRVRRQAGEPLSRIRGTREFYGLDFALNADTLDPRADSETLIDAAFDWYRQRGSDTAPRILDLGTGTGCLLLTLLYHWRKATGIGIDRSYNAALQALTNAACLNVQDRSLFVAGDWLGAIGPKSRFDLVIANPPYIPRKDVAGLENAVKNYDPVLALDGGEDGLDPYKTLVYALPTLLTPGGAGLFEVGINQADDVAAMGVQSGATHIRTHADSGGIQRVVDIRYGDKYKKS
ncbi:MAG: peptide chain release factor N(5)-glutamine methyltransferase [Pseudomonadota bacterium]